MILSILGVPFDPAAFGADQTVEVMSWVRGKFSNLPKGLEASVEKAIEAAVASRGWDDAAALQANTILALSHAQPLPAVVVQSFYDSNLIARAVVTTGKARTRAIDAGEWDRIELVLREAFEPLVASRQLLAETELAFRIEFLNGQRSIAELIRSLPETLASSVDRITARSLIDPPRSTTVTHSLAARLVAANAVVPFAGRENDLHTLVTWCQSDARISIHLVYGKGGGGKTRLAIELLKRLAQDGWEGGFLQAGADDARGGVLRALIDRAYPTLIVVDYAEARVEIVATLLQLLADHPPGGRVRLLLLARSDGDWRAQLEERAGKGRSLFIGAYRATALADLAPTPEARRQQFAEAATAFAAHFAFTEPGRPIIESPSVPPDIDDETYGNALVLQAAALLRTLSDDDVKSGGVVAELFARERNQWRTRLSLGSTPKAGMACTRRLVAAVTLLGGCDSALLPSLMAISQCPGEQGCSVMALVRDFYSTDTNRIDALRPDVLGEHLVSEAITDTRFALDVLDAACNTDPRQKSQIVRTWLSVLARAAAQHDAFEVIVAKCLAERIKPLLFDAVAVAQQIGDPLGKVLTQVVEQASDRLPLEELHRAISGETVALKELALLCARTVVSTLPAKPQDRKSRDRRLEWLGNLAAREAKAGNLEKALRIARELDQFVHSIWPEPAKVGGRERHEALRAAAYSRMTLSVQLADNGQVEEALSMSEDAVTFSRLLWLDDKPMHRQNYGITLSNYSQRLSENKRWRDAVDAANRALRLRKEIQRDGSDLRNLDIAYMLRNRGVALIHMTSEPDRVRQGIKDLEESVSILRAITDGNPDDGRESLANDEMLLAGGYVNVNEAGNALGPATRSVVEFRVLAEKRPMVFGPQLIEALRIRSFVRAEVGDRSGACVDVQEAERRLTSILDHPRHADLSEAIAHQRDRLNSNSLTDDTG